MKRIFLALLAALALLPAFAQVTADGTKTGIHTGTIGTVTWAARPTCTAALTGYAARISDVGPAPGMRVMCDGTRWLPDGPQVLARGTVTVSVTGTANETTLASGTLPGGLMGPNSSLRFYILRSYTNNANTKSARIRLGGTAFYANASSATAALASLHVIANRNSTSSQVSGVTSTSGFNTSAGAPTVGAVDTTSNQTWSITDQLSVTTDTAALESYVLEVLP